MKTASTDGGCSVEYYPVDLEKEKRRYYTIQGNHKQTKLPITLQRRLHLQWRQVDRHTSDMFQQSLLLPVAIIDSSSSSYVCHIEG